MQAFRRSRDGCSLSFTTVHSSFTNVRHSFILVQKTCIKMTVKQTSDVMSYDYAPSCRTTIGAHCRTFIAPHVVRHDNLIKTALKYICFVIQIYKNHRQFLLFHTSSLEMPDNPKRRRMRSKTSFDASFFVLAGKPCHILI